MARKSKISPYLHLLGRIPDQQIAKMAGLSQSASVQAQRKKLKINSFRENFIKIEKALKKMKKNVLDEDAAKSLDVPVELFTAVRHYEDLIKNPQAVSKKYKIDKHVLQAMLDKSTHKKSGRKKKSESTKVSIKKPITKKSSTKKEKVKKSSAKKETAKKSSAKKEKVKKSSAKKETAKKSSTKKETAKKSSTKKETAKKSSAKKEAKVKRKYTKRQPVQKSVFLQAYECTFTSGEDFMSIFVNASTFAEAAAKVESIQTDKSIKGRLSAIRNIGIAVQ